MKVEEYRELLHEDSAIACEANSNDNESEEFLSYVTGILMSGEEFDDFIECHCEGGTPNTAAFYSIDGYAIDEADGSCCVFIVDYHGPYGDDRIIAKNIETAFNKIRRFVEKSIKTELYREIDNRAAMEFSRDLFYDNEKITKYRFYLLTDAYNRQKAKTIKDDMINNRIVELNVWDIERLYDLVCSQAQKESVEIFLGDFGIEGIPCVKAVEHTNVVADIDVSPLIEDEDDSAPANIITYSSYLAVVPGTVLNQLYLDYGAKLLEGNVRSFLSAKGKVNKGKITEETIKYKNQNNISYVIKNRSESFNRNSFWVKLKDFRFKVYIIGASNDKKEYSRYVIEYRKKWGEIPDEDKRYDIATFLSFIIGTKLIKFGESYFNDDYITQKEYISPTAIDISLLYQTNFPFYIEDCRYNDTDNVIKQLPKMLRKYFLLKEKYRLNEALSSLYIKSYLNFNFINYVTYIEMFANIDVDKKTSLVPKAKFRKVLKELNEVKKVPQTVQQFTPTTALFLYINQHSKYKFSRPCFNILHTVYPLQLIFFFQLFGYTFCLFHLFHKSVKHLLSLSVNIRKILPQFAFSKHSHKHNFLILQKIILMQHTPFAEADS